MDLSSITGPAANCECPFSGPNVGYVYSEGGLGACGLGYVPSSNPVCILPDGRPGKRVCSTPPSSATILKNCNPPFRCLRRVRKQDGKEEVEVESMTGLVQIQGEYYCVDAAMEISLYIPEDKGSCQENELERCVLLTTPKTFKK